MSSHRLTLREGLAVLVREESGHLAAWYARRLGISVGRAELWLSLDDLQTTEEGARWWPRLSTLDSLTLPDTAKEAQ